MLAVAALAVHLTSSLWLVYRTGATNGARRADAIVVMGAAQYDGRPSPVLAARLDQVVLLWRQGWAPLVITTGGNLPGDRYTEAEASTNYLIERGVPGTAILEVGGSTSYAELEGVAELLGDRGLSSVLLVSDPYHALRIRLVAEELGLSAAVSPTRTSPVDGWHEAEMHLKEAVGVAVGRIIGFDRLLSLTG